MQAESEKQQSWKIRVHARSKSFHFKFKATTTLPTLKFHRLSILLRLHKFLLQVKSQRQQQQQQRPTLKSRFLTAFHKLRALRVKNRNPEVKPSINRLKRFAYEEPICISSLVIGIVALVLRTICEIDYKRIVVLGSVTLLYFAIFLWKYVTGKSTTVLAFSVVATVVCLVARFRLDTTLNWCQGYIAAFVLKTWNYICCNLLVT
ncbi:hypothetical protein ACOSQ4_029464 [Xanthoceras sorbifolium]